MIRVLLVAPYASGRAGLHALLGGAADCEVVGQASGPADLEWLLPDLRPDVVLLDALPGDGARVIALLADSGAGLVLLGEGSDAGLPLVRSGLSGWAWLGKDADAGEIVGAVRAVAAGLAALDPSLVPLLAPGPSLTRADAAPPDETLTAREREVLQLMARGLPNKQIATRLTISPHTVKFHVAAILAKLDAASRTEAVTLGARRGWVLL